MGEAFARGGDGVTWTLSGMGFFTGCCGMALGWLTLCFVVGTFSGVAELAML
jgi:hypothetical protein